MKAIRSIPAVAALALLAACAGDTSPVAAPPSDAAPLLAAAPDRAVAGRYIVVLREGADPRAAAAVAGVQPRHVYQAALTGFAAELNAGQLAALRHHPAVEYVEQDQVAGAAQLSLPWGLDRIDQHNLPLNGQYNPTGGSGSGVNAYVIDTGIQTGHPQFGGRALVAYDALGGNGQDCNGHGTHVAGIIGSSGYGVAKQVRLWAVRVLDCNGSGSFSGVLAGIDWVRANHRKPAVANVSLGGGFSSTLNTAVTNLSNAGVFVAVAAGNSGGNACNTSPAAAPAVTTVAASTITDARAPYSNYGSCVDLYAPGTAIPSTWIGSGTRTLSGTSMAAPHVAGSAVRYKSGFLDASQATIDTWLKNRATVGVITGNVTGTPNRLLYIGP